MKRAVFVVSAAALLQPIGAQAADEPRVLAPSSGWTLDFADERCSLIRDFGEGDDKLRLQIDSYGTRHGYRVMISGDPVPRGFNVPITEVRVGYSPDTQRREQLTAMTGTSGETTAASFTGGFLPDPRTLDQALLVPQPTPEQVKEADRISEEFENAVTHVTVQFGLRKAYQLNTGMMAAPFAAMDKCVDDLISSWGFDPAAHWTRMSGPAPIPETLEALQRSFPPRPARDRIGSFLPVRVSVDETGRATHCVVQLATIEETYKQSICEGLSGRYVPALDAAGQPIASFYLTTSIYQLGG